MRIAIVMGPENFGQKMILWSGQYGIQAPGSYGLDYTDPEGFDRDMISLLETMEESDTLCLLAASENCEALQHALLCLKEKSPERKGVIICGISLPGLITALLYKDAVDTDFQLVQTIQSEQGANVKAIEI